MEPRGFRSGEPLRPAGSALIRCAGADASGYASVRRMVALARALSDCEGIRVSFAVNGDDNAVIAVRRAGFEAHRFAAGSQFMALVRTQKPDILVLDGRDGSTSTEAQALRGFVTLMAAIDDSSDLRLACDFAYYPPLPEAMALGWAGARTVPRIGWEWLLLGSDPRPAPARGSRPVLLVAMGGGDPLGLTTRIAQLLAPLDSAFRIRFVIDKSIKDANTVAAGIVAMKSNYETVEGADDLSTEYASAELALCAFGPAAYALAAFGVPALYLGLDDDDVGSASAFAAAGMGESLGTAQRVTDRHILDAIRALMNDPARRREMRRVGLAVMDGGGAVRIAADLAQALQQEKMPLRAVSGKVW